MTYLDRESAYSLETQLGLWKLFLVIEAIKMIIFKTQFTFSFSEFVRRVAYRCNSDLLMGSDGGNEFYRECVDASWFGETPECGELRVFNVVIKFNYLLSE